MASQEESQPKEIAHPILSCAVITEDGLLVQSEPNLDDSLSIINFGQRMDNREDYDVGEFAEMTFAVNSKGRLTVSVHDDQDCTTLTKDYCTLQQIEGLKKSIEIALTISANALLDSEQPHLNLEEGA